MHGLGVQKKTTVKRAFAYTACAILLILADALFWFKVAWAAPAYTPYANSVAAQSALGGGTANNAVGPPNQQYASLLGLNSSLTLDMGDGEEGTNALKVYFGPLNLQAQVELQFLDDGQGVIKSETRQLFSGVNAAVETFAYDWRDFDEGYRFVKITALVGVSVGIDSVEALGFIGSSVSQDTDGDGTPDREDDEPLVFNKPADDDDDGGGGSGGGSNTNNSSKKTTTIIRTTTSKSSGATPTVNEAPSSKNDKDGDQMDDAWERKNRLDPSNPADADQDTDADGLVNLREYQFDTNPRAADTEGDGMPDGWEVENGLNAKVDDAEQDPDSDYITNLGEYNLDTNPYRADDLTALSARIHMKERWWSWAIFGLLLALSALCLMRARKLASQKYKTSSSKKASSRGSLPPL